MVLYVNANLPNGSTLEQMNDNWSEDGNLMSDFKEIRQFRQLYIAHGRQTYRFTLRKKWNTVASLIH